MRFPTRTLLPNYWPSWLAAGLLWLVARLPYRHAIGVGEALGRALYPLARRRRRIVEVNLRLCFPELDAAEREALARKNFAYTGRALIEMALSWWTPERRLRDLVSYHGIEHLETALAEGRGVLLVGAHFTSLEMAGRLLALRQPFDSIYRPNNNPVFEYLTQRGREDHYGQAIPRGEVRALVRALKQGHVLWYPPDQDYGRRNSLFVPFFGIPAATITGTPKLAKIADAPVVTIFFYGRDDASGYDLYFEPLADFPGGEPEADLARLNTLFEQAIRRAPAQYLWVHRRFKTRPNRDDPRYY